MGKAQVLIVDDSLTVRTDLQDLFESVGFGTTLCSTAADARKALLQPKFQLIVLDIRLPDADGTDLLKEIKTTQATAHLPVMILSSKTEVNDRIRGISTGAIEYIGKPYDRSYVIGRAGELLKNEETQSAPRDAPVILVIDDSKTSREKIKAALEAAGLVVHLAETGEEGLRLAARLRPDALLIDGKLPGIDGPTVVRRLRSDSLLRTTPCILLTDSQDREDEFRALEAGSDTYIRKNEDPEVLLAKLTAVLRSSKSAVAPSTESSSLGPKKILAVDDSPTYLSAVADPLRLDGYDVITVPSGEQALELLAVQLVDCILLDLTMPGLSGQETCRRIKASPFWRDIPLVMLTAREDREAMLDSFDAGADDYIPKSNEFVVLKARVRAQLRRKQFEDENRSIREELVRKKLEALEANSNRELAETRGKLLLELEYTNKELEAFSYSVSHDLRAPLRSIGGFSQILLEEHSDKLNDQGKDYLKRVCTSCQRMTELIDDLLSLSRISRNKMNVVAVDLSALARSIASTLHETQPNRKATFNIVDGLVANGDSGLLRIALENLLGNAWKYTSKVTDTKIEFGQTQHQGKLAYFVRDNGVGFDMNYAEKLFAPFQRLHSTEEFEGTGIGLATVRRTIQRHGGMVWAESGKGSGASFYFTIP